MYRGAFPVRSATKGEGTKEKIWKILNKNSRKETNYCRKQGETPVITKGSKNTKADGKRVFNKKNRRKRTRGRREKIPSAIKSQLCPTLWKGYWIKQGRVP